MKKLFLLCTLFCALITTINAQQQLPNHSFEKGQGSVPDIWEAQSGLAARSQKITLSSGSNSQTIMAEDSSYMMVLKTNQDSVAGTVSLHAPYSDKPKYLQCYGIFLPDAYSDSFGIVLKFSKYDPLSHRSVVVHEAVLSENAPLSSWTRLYMPVDYPASADAPDSIQVILMSSYSNSGRSHFDPASLFLVDNIMFTNNDPSSISTATSPQSFIHVFPNPSGSIVHLQYDELLTGPVSTNIYDISGRLVQHVNHVVSGAPVDLQLDVSNYKPGLYFFEMGNEACSGYGRFSVAR